MHSKDFISVSDKFCKTFLTILLLIMTPVYIITTASNRVVKQSLQALLKTKAITHAHKLSSKSYIPNEKGRLQTQISQIIICYRDSNWAKSGESILTAILKDRQYISSSSIE